MAGGKRRDSKDEVKDRGHKRRRSSREDESDGEGREERKRKSSKKLSSKGSSKSSSKKDNSSRKVNSSKKQGKATRRRYESRENRRSRHSGSDNERDESSFDSDESTSHSSNVSTSSLSGQTPTMSSAKRHRQARSRKALKKLLDSFPEVSSELRQLLARIDDGEAVDISGLPDASLRTLLKALLKSLPLKRTKGGAFARRKQAGVSCVGILESMLEENNRRGGERAEREEGEGQARKEVGEVGREKEGRGDEGMLIEGMEGKSEGEEGAKQPEGKEADSMQKKKTNAERMAEGDALEAMPVGPQPRRVVGPAMPSEAQLQAAAKLTEALSMMSDGLHDISPDAADGDSLLIGPVPPAAAAEAENATEAERFEQVEAILAPSSDAYAILGVNQEASGADLKRRYLKISLLVHPDKCRHPKAQDAFQALNRALKELQDPSKRAALDAAIEKKQLQKEYEEDLRSRREAAEWRRLRGEPLPEDAALLGSEGGEEQQGRDEWMTELPPERQARMATTNTFFSTKEKTGRGDTSGWTDTPQQRAERAKTMYLEAYSQAMLTGPAQAQQTAEEVKDSRTAAMLDAYNEKKRAKSLVEIHKKKLEEVDKEERKKKRKKAKEGQGGGKAATETKEWRMWDREKDLEIKPKSFKLKSDFSAGLASKFGTSQRKFL